MGGADSVLVGAPWGNGPPGAPEAKKTTKCGDEDLVHQLSMQSSNSLPITGGCSPIAGGPGGIGKRGAAPGCGIIQGAGGGNRGAVTYELTHSTNSKQQVKSS